jgi:hypothetical protein
MIRQPTKTKTSKGSENDVEGYISTKGDGQFGLGKMNATLQRSDSLLKSKSANEKNFNNNNNSNNDSNIA